MDVGLGPVPRFQREEDEGTTTANPSAASLTLFALGFDRFTPSACRTAGPTPSATLRALSLSRLRVSQACVEVARDTWCCATEHDHISETGVCPFFVAPPCRLGPPGDSRHRRVETRPPLRAIGVGQRPPPHANRVALHAFGVWKHALLFTPSAWDSVPLFTPTACGNTPPSSRQRRVETRPPLHALGVWKHALLLTPSACGNTPSSSRQRRGTIRARGKERQRRSPG